MPNKLPLDEERALVRLMTQGKEARPKLEDDKGKLTADERKELLACVVKGEQAREKLILAHIGLVKSIAADLCKKYGCRFRREELISEGHVALIKAVDGFKPELGWRVVTYAYQRIWGVMMSLLGNLPPHDESLDSPQRNGDDKPGEKSADPAVDLEGDLIRRERSRLLHRAIGKLSEKERVVILLQLEGLSEKEIAERLGWPQGTIKSHLYRTRIKLCEILNGGGENA